MDEQMNIFGQIMKDARKVAGLAQDDLAKQSGVATRYIMSIENENR